MKPPKIKASYSIVEHLISASKEYQVSSWDFKEWRYGQAAASIIQTTTPLTNFLNSVKKDFESQGFVIINFDLDPWSRDAATICTYLLSIFGTPFRVFKNQIGHWRKLEVNLDRPPNRSGGVGLSFLHMDFVNASNPPDIVCLFALRRDPALGGESTISLLDGIEHVLSKEHVGELSKPQFNDGVVVNLNGVGDDINPFAVLNPDSSWRYRFSGNLLESAPDRLSKEAVLEMYNILESRKRTVLLEPGDLLILNQHRVVHGRMPLGSGQEKILPENRRFLLHSFVRTN